MSTCDFCLRHSDDCPFCLVSPPPYLRFLWVPCRAEEPVRLIRLPTNWEERIQCIGKMMSCDWPERAELHADGKRAVVVYHRRADGEEPNPRLDNLVTGNALLGLHCVVSGEELSMPIDILQRSHHSSLPP